MWMALELIELEEGPPMINKTNSGNRFRNYSVLNPGLKNGTPNSGVEKIVLSHFLSSVAFNIFIVSAF